MTTEQMDWLDDQRNAEAADRAKRVDQVKRRVCTGIIAVVATVLMWFVGSIAWAEFGPAGQRQAAIDECVETHTDVLVNHPDVNVDTFGETVDIIIADCKAKHGE